jgi:hypothetical protein
VLDTVTLVYWRWMGCTVDLCYIKHTMIGARTEKLVLGMLDGISDIVYSLAR